MYVSMYIKQLYNNMMAEPNSSEAYKGDQVKESVLARVRDFQALGSRPRWTSCVVFSITTEESPPLRFYVFVEIYCKRNNNKSEKEVMNEE